MPLEEIVPAIHAASNARFDVVNETQQEREERMNLALDSAGVGTWNWRIPADAITWDERMHDLFGIERGTFPGNYEFFAHLVHPDDRERVSSEVLHAVNGDVPFDSQYRVIWPLDGSEHVVAARGKVYRDASGAPVRMTGVCWDITERRKIEEQLARERYMLHSLIENIPDRIYFKDTESRFIRINPALARLFKLDDPHEAVGKTDFDFFTKEHAEPAFHDDQEVMRTGLPLIGKIEKETLPNGRVCWSMTTKMRLRDEDGRIAGTFGISRDITELRRADDALRESEQRYSRLLDSVTDYVYTVRIERGEVVSTSHGPGCLTVTGYAPDEFQSDAWLWHRIIHPEDRELVVENIARMIQEHVPRTIEHRLVRKDGGVRWVHNKQVPRYDEARRLVSYDGLVSDITERKLAEDRVRTVLADLRKSHEELKAAQMQLIQAEKLQSIGRLAAGVAHEVKNPLATLQMGIQCLRDTGAGTDPATGAILSEMQDSVTRASNVIGDLLNLASPKEIGLRDVSLNPIVEKTLRFVRHEALSQKIKIVRRLAEDIPLCSADPDKIEQVLINLLTNACDAMPDGGTLTVTTLQRTLDANTVAFDAGDRGGVRFHAGEKVAALEITDTGTGIPADKLQKIFDPFYTSKPTGKGTGLGLSVAQKIVELHKGLLTIANREGGGVVATLILRVAG